MILRLFRYLFPKPKTMSEQLEELVKSIPPGYLEQQTRDRLVGHSKFGQPVILTVEHGIVFKEDDDTKKNS